MNDLTKEDIKQSIEYQWRIYNLKLMLFILLFIGLITLIFPLLFVVQDFNKTNFKLYFETILIMMLVYLIIFIPFLIYYLYKALYILKKYKYFEVHEVILDHPHTSYLYKGLIYYSVSLKHNDSIITVNTNPYFSSNIFSKYELEKYNNKKVKGLYDEKMGKFYILK